MMQALYTGVTNWQRVNDIVDSLIVQEQGVRHKETILSFVLGSDISSHPQVSSVQNYQISGDISVTGYKCDKTVGLPDPPSTSCILLFV